jgi:hypothetical protein
MGIYHFVESIDHFVDSQKISFVRLGWEVRLG